VRLAISNLLKADGFTVLTADDGKAAMEISRSYPGTIHLVLSDMDMPKWAVGNCAKNLQWNARLAVHNLAPRIKVLLMSGGLDAREQARMNGLPFVQKPFAATAARHSIKALLGPNPPLRTPSTTSIPLPEHNASTCRYSDHHSRARRR
jgi:DNA-binding NtrC family response regulator